MSWPQAGKAIVQHADADSAAATLFIALTALGLDRSITLDFLFLNSHKKRLSEARHCGRVKRSYNGGPSWQTVPVIVRLTMPVDCAPRLSDTT
jgi:hypothetical protein